MPPLPKTPLLKALLLEDPATARKDDEGPYE